MKNEEFFMHEALIEGKNAKAHSDLPFGAVIVRDGTIIGRGKAENNTTGDVTSHAEVNALKQACNELGKNDLKDCTIYCTNEPCNMCASAIFQANIGQVVIGLSRSDLPNILRPRNITITDLANDSGFPITIKKGILKDEILALFESIKK